MTSMNIESGEREEDARLLAGAVVRAASSDGSLVDLDDLAAELEIDLE